MSGSNEQRENIQRLAKGVKMKGGLGPVGTREPIRGKVTPFSDNTFAPPSTAPAGYTEPACSPNNNNEETDSNEPQEPIDPNDPNTFVRGTAGQNQQTEQGVADIGDAIDGTAGPQMPTTGGGTSGTGGLRELTGLKDCETGKEFNLHLDGNFVPPEGWDDPDTPPDEIPDESFVLGRQWQIVGGDDSFHATSYQAALNEVSATPSIVSIISGPRIVTTSQHNYLMDYVEPFANSEITAFGYSCTPSESDPLCPTQKPVLASESWPEDGTYDVAIKDGQFQTNLFDADAPDSFEPRGTLDFCYGEGGTGRAEVTADGGVVYYGTDVNGAPTGTARVLDSSGQLVAAGDATDSFITQYLPQ